MSIKTIVDDFEFLDDWEDRYRYVIELGKALAPLPDDERTDANKVNGCVSQVWLSAHFDKNEQGEPLVSFIGDSDAHIVRGLVAILIAMFSNRPAIEIIDTDPMEIFNQLGLKEHLTPQRSNGLFSMVERVKHDARQALSPAH
ncbi:MAG: SufE family protein [Rhizobiales bacterium]|nr:SufE family protein [Hyphomicrobiales bacterium]